MTSPGPPLADDGLSHSRGPALRTLHPQTQPPALEVAGDIDKQLITHGMTKRVIDGLETVYVDKKEAKGFSLRFRRGQHRPDFLLEMTAIWKFG